MRNVSEPVDDGRRQLQARVRQRDADSRHSSESFRDSRGTAHFRPLEVKNGPRKTRIRSCGELNDCISSSSAACSCRALSKTATRSASDLAASTSSSCRSRLISNSSEWISGQIRRPSLEGAIAVDISLHHLISGLALYRTDLITPPNEMRVRMRFRFPRPAYSTLRHVSTKCAIESRATTVESCGNGKL